MKYPPQQYATVLQPLCLIEFFHLVLESQSAIRPTSLFLTLILILILVVILLPPSSYRCSHLKLIKMFCPRQDPRAAESGPRIGLINLQKWVRRLICHEHFSFYFAPDLGTWLLSPRQNGFEGKPNKYTVIHRSGEHGKQKATEWMKMKMKMNNKMGGWSVWRVESSGGRSWKSYLTKTSEQEFIFRNPRKHY